jgi:hypothetical protein
MDADVSLKALVLQNGPIAAAIGQRYYIDRIPEGITTYPIVRAQIISDSEQDTHSSTWGSRITTQVDVWDDDKQNCNITAALVRGWLHRYYGAFGEGNAIIKVRNAPSVPDPETKLFRKILEVDILYTI